MRRMTVRNERSLYKRKCDAPGHTEELVSVFSPEKKLTVYDDRYWWSDAWNPVDYGREYDFSKPFFLQFRELLERVPLISLSITNMADCSYCNVSEGDKDCYLISATWHNEHVLYSNRVASNKDCMDLYASNSNELCYELVHCEKCYKTKWSRDCVECADSALLYNCVGCNNCFGCTNLRNKSYYFFNEPCTKEDYAKKVAQFDMGSRAGVRTAQKRYEEVLARSIRRFAMIFKSTDVTGDNAVNAKNCRMCFDMTGSPSAEDSKFLAWGGIGIKDSYDGGPGIGDTAEQLYDATDTGIESSRTFFTNVVYGSFDVEYSINCHGSHHLFGCYGIRNKQYCILNREYSKEEYEALMPRIREHMNLMPFIGGKRQESDDKAITYKYGEFFPPELALFAYNETIAQEYYPLTKEQALERGFPWRDPDPRHYSVTLSPANVSDGIRNVTDDILKQTVGCAHGGTCTHQCTEAFRVIKDELAFYRSQNIPLPQLCYNCRHYARLAQRNPLKLWHRKCQCAGAKSEKDVYANTAPHFHGSNHCPNEFETTYAPERPEVVYCENCYQAEVV